MNLIKFRTATIIIMAITAIVCSKDDNIPISLLNIFVMLLINKIIKTQFLFLLCMYSFICMILSVDYIKKKKLFLIYFVIAIVHIIQLVSVINILFSTM